VFVRSELCHLSSPSNHHIQSQRNRQQNTEMADEIVDDKSEHCIPFILDKIKAHRDYHKKEGTAAPPFFLGLNGIQGAGKTTLVSNLNYFESSTKEHGSQLSLTPRMVQLIVSALHHTHCRVEKH
jgi:pantothenate kinase-related protein Tda10